MAGSKGLDPDLGSGFLGSNDKLSRHVKLFKIIKYVSQLAINSKVIWYGFNGQFNEALQVSKRFVELSTSYDNEKFPKNVLPNSRHVSSIKQDRVLCSTLYFKNNMT